VIELSSHFSGRLAPPARLGAILLYVGLILFLFTGFATSFLLPIFMASSLYRRVC
jgi:hypothetical protein